MKLKNVLCYESGNLVACDFTLSAGGKLTKDNQLENSLEFSVDMTSQYILITGLLNNDITDDSSYSVLSLDALSATDSWAILDNTTRELLLSCCQGKVIEHPAFIQRVSVDSRYHMFAMLKAPTDGFTNMPAVNSPT